LLVEFLFYSKLISLVNKCCCLTLYLVALTAFTAVKASTDSTLNENVTPVIHIAVEPTPPFSTIDSHGEISGLDKDLAEALLVPLGYKIRMVPCPWVRCLRMVEEGKVDMIFGLSKNALREKKFIFLEPPFITSTTEIASYQLADSTFKVTQLSDFHSLDVGVQRGALHFQAFDNDSQINKTELKDITTMINMLVKGRIDTFVMPTVAAEQYLAQLNYTNLVKRGEFTHIEEQGGYMVLSKLSKHRNAARIMMQRIEKLKQSGQLHTILKTYHVE